MLLADMHTSGEEVICEAIAVDLVEGAIVEQVEDTVSRGEAGDFCTGFARPPLCWRNALPFHADGAAKVHAIERAGAAPLFDCLSGWAKGVFLLDPIRPARGFAM